MKCEEVNQQIPLYVYGELPQEAEEHIESHCAACGLCGGELGRFRKMLAAFDRHRLDATADLVAQSRAELATLLEREEQAPRPRESWFANFKNALHQTMHSSVRFRVPVGAMALVALGYFGARVSPMITGGGMNAASLGSADPVISVVKSVEPDANGRVLIGVDEVRRRTISGKLNDRDIQRLLLTAVKEESNPGVRVESVDALKDQAGSAEVRTALLDAVAHDPNPGVRLKAIEGLKSFSKDAATRKVLSQVLLADTNPGVRIQAIDLLMTSRDQSMVGLLQNVVRKEDNNYVRIRCKNALQDMHASVGTF